MDLLQRFHYFLLGQKKKPSKATVKNYKADVGQFIRWVEARTNQEFTPATISPLVLKEYKTYKTTSSEAKGLSASSVDRHFSSLRKFFQFLTEEKQIGQNPFEQMQSATTEAAAKEDPWLLKNFKNYLYVYNASPLTIKNYLIDVRQFLDWAEEVTGVKDAWHVKDKNLFDKLNPLLVKEYKLRLLHDAKYSPSSINRKLSSLRKYLDWAQNEGLIHLPGGVAPAAHLEGVKITTKKSAFADFGDSTKVRYEPELSPEKTLAQNLKNVKSTVEVTGIAPAESWVIIQVPHSGTPTSPSTLSGKETARQHSLFPPLRLLQKITKAISFLFDSSLILPLVKVIERLEISLFKLKPRSVFQQIYSRKSASTPRISNIPKSFYAPTKISTQFFPFHKKIFWHIQYNRPDWYKKAQNTALFSYFRFAILVIFFMAITLAGYKAFFEKPSQEKPVLAAAVPNRILSFQGRLTDSSNNPITTKKNVRFIIYIEPTASGSARQWEELDTVTPDTDGVFSVLLGFDGSKNNATTCGLGSPATRSCGIPQSLFSQYGQLWLGVTIGNDSELTPRQQLATVAYATNAEVLQGLPPTTDSAWSGGTANTNAILALNASGTVAIPGSASTTLQATGGQFVLSGQGTIIQSNSGSAANVALSPDGLGKIDLQKPLQNSTNNNNITTAAGAVEVDDMFAILATSSGQSAFTINQNSTGPLISASSSGTARFTVDYAGNGYFAGNVGIGTNAPDAALEINHATGDSLRLTYNDSDGSATNYTDFSLGSTGGLTLTGSAATLADSASAEKTYLTLTPGTITLTGTTTVSSVMDTAIITGATIAASAATTVTDAANLSLTAPVDSTNATLTRSSALMIKDTSSGAGTLTSLIGLYIAPQTGGASNNYGICFDCDGTWTSSTVASGIQFGTDANAVNLYRSASDTLRSDDSLSLNAQHILSIAAGGEVVFNETSADIDFRVEADGNSKAIFVDAGLNTVSIGGNNIASAFLTIDPDNTDTESTFADAVTPALTTGHLLTTSAISVRDANTAASGVAAAMNNIVFRQPTFRASNTGVTVTDAANLYIANAPTAGTNMTLTNAYALWTDEGLVRFDRDSIGTTATDGLRLMNNTDAAAGAQQYSPALRFRGEGWKTDATAASQNVDWRMYTVPVQAAANPTSYLAFDSSVNDAAFSNVMALTSAGNVGIGTTTPGAKLEVAGTLLVSGTITSSQSSNITIQHSTSELTLTYPVSTQFLLGEKNAGTETYMLTIDSSAAKDVMNLLPSGGVVGIQGSANAKMTTGLNINQGSADDQILAFRSSDVAHGMTDRTGSDGTSTYGLFQKADATLGGMIIEGLTEDQYAIYMVANSTNNVTTKSATSKANMIIDTYKKNGADIGANDANSNLLAILTSGNTRFIFDAEGTGHADDVWTDNAFDLAEDYPVVSGESLEEGDVVRVEQSQGYIKKTTQVYDNQILGVISYHTAQLSGFADKDKDGNLIGNKPVALIGRVPVKISLENGTIKVGEYLTSSSTPGVAMKATKFSTVIGKALEDYDGSVKISAGVNNLKRNRDDKTNKDPGDGIGKILVYISVAQADPNNVLALLNQKTASLEAELTLLLDQQKIRLAVDSLTELRTSVATPDLSGVNITYSDGVVKWVDPTGVAPAQPDLTDPERHLSEPTPISLSQLLTNLVNEQASLSSRLSTSEESPSSPPSEVSLTATGDLVLASPGTIQNPALQGDVPSGTSQGDALQTSGGLITRVGAFAEAIIGKVRAGLLEAEKVTTNSLTITTENMTIAGVNLHDYITTIVDSQIGNWKLEIGNSAPAVVSPLASIDQLKVNTISPLASGTITVSGNASISGQLQTDKIVSNTVSTEGLNVTNDATISGTLHAKKIIADQIEGLEARVSSIAAETVASSKYEVVSFSDSIDIASYSAQLSNVENLTAAFGQFNQGLIALGPTSLTDTAVAGQLSISGKMVLTDNTINTLLGATLELQPLRQGGLSIMAGLVYIDTDGNAQFNGNATFAKDVTVKGKLAANIISPLASSDLSVNLGGNDSTTSSLLVNNASGSGVLKVDQKGNITASGSGTFASVIANALNIVRGAQADTSLTETVASGSAGTATIIQGETERTIINSTNMTEKSLIYLSAASDTLGLTPYVARQTKESFTIQIPQSISKDIKINWWIVN